ncbi:MAG: hypothetical protein ABJE66_30080 [Deltaproteobacteria bacterium]
MAHHGGGEKQEGAIQLDLQAIVSGDGLEQVIVSCMVAAGIWTGRDSDGASGERLACSTDDHIVIRGRIHHIDQTLHQFWLELLTTARGGRWALWYDLAEHPRHGDAFTSTSHKAISWRHNLDGRIDVVEGELDFVYACPTLAPWPDPRT